MRERSGSEPYFSGFFGLPFFLAMASAGSWLHPGKVTDLFERLVAASGLPPIRLHDLRHGAATLSVFLGEDHAGLDPGRSPFLAVRVLLFAVPSSRLVSDHTHRGVELFEPDGT